MSQQAVRASVLSDTDGESGAEGDLKDVHIQYKFILIGDAKVGKSCFLYHFVTGSFKDVSKATLGVEFGSKKVVVMGRRVKLCIWDTAGNERFQALTRTYYRNAVGVLIMYDMTDRSSFNRVPKWIRDARKYAGKNASIVLVGNKKDLVEDGPASIHHEDSSARTVGFLEGSQLAQAEGLHFFETSAFTGMNVANAFMKCAHTIAAKVDRGDIELERIPSLDPSDWEQKRDGTNGCLC